MTKEELDKKLKDLKNTRKYLIHAIPVKNSPQWAKFMYFQIKYLYELAQDGLRYRFIKGED